MNTNKKIRRMVVTAVLAALILVLAFTPLGYLKLGALSITFIMIPVVVGAIMEGPGVGAVLGAVFGLSSFVQCFGMDAFGTTLMGIQPVYTFIMCFVPRVLMGCISGLIFKGLYKVEKSGLLGCLFASLSGAVLNTLLFVGALLLFFGGSEFVQGFGNNAWEIITALITINALVEAGVCLVIGTSISFSLLQALKIK